MGVPGRVWARRFLPVAVRFFVEAVLGLAQVSEREGNDKVMHAGFDQVRRWHELAMPCHGMAMFDSFDLSLTSASGGDGVVR
jgi:hypothetical protein